MAELFLGQNQEECPTESNECPPEPDKCQNTPKPINDSEEVNIEKPQDTNSIQINVEEVHEESQPEDLTVAMAYDIQTNNPFSKFTDRFLSLRNLFVKTEKFTKEKDSITIEEIAKTPLPKPRKKQFTRKLRHRHFISTPSIQSQIRKILTSYKCQHFGSEIQEFNDTEDFHSTGTGGFFEESTKPEIFSIQESEEVFDLNVVSSKSDNSANSSKLEYEVASDLNVFTEQDLDDSKEFLDIKDENINEPISILNQFISLILDACEQYGLGNITKNNEETFEKVVKNSIEMYPELQHVMETICGLQFKAFEPFITKSNYSDIKDILRFFKILRSECGETSLPVNFFLQSSTFITLFSQILKKIENQITDKILQFQSDNVEEEYCCAVYYPIIR